MSDKDFKIQMLIGELARLRQENKDLRRKHKRMKKKHEFIRNSIGQDNWSYLDEVLQTKDLAKIKVNTLLSPNVGSENDNGLKGEVVTSEFGRDTGFYGIRSDVVSDGLDHVAREDLRDALVEIYEMVFCDETGLFCPEDSIAAQSAADFLGEVEFTFRRLGSLPTEESEKK